MTQIVSSADTIKTLENMLQDCVRYQIRDFDSYSRAPGVMTLWYYWMSRVEDEEEEEESTWKQGIVKLAKVYDAVRNTASSSDENVREMLN